jgi:hypothetical protein
MHITSFALTHDACECESSHHILFVWISVTCNTALLCLWKNHQYAYNYSWFIFKSNVTNCIYICDFLPDTPSGYLMTWLPGCNVELTNISSAYACAASPVQLCLHTVTVVSTSAVCRKSKTVSCANICFTHMISVVNLWVSDPNCKQNYVFVLPDCVIPLL